MPNDASMYPLAFDTDQDGKQNLVLYSRPSPWPICFWEHIGFDRYILEDTAVPWSALWDVGYLDADSLVDLVGNRNGTFPYPLYVYESPNQNSHPTNVVWQDSGFMNISGGYITDLDQDGLKEILFGYYNGGPHTCVYENTGDNQYVLVWEDTLNMFYRGVNDDFDMDGKIEFITGWGSSGQVRVWECIGDNDYQLVFIDTLPWANNSDIFKASDMDGNGKPEFLFTSVHYALGIAWLYCYESIGDNDYDFFLIDSIIGLPSGMSYTHSKCADIDADGIEEIVWSTFNQWHIYKATGIQQYQKVYSSNWTQHDEARMAVFDLNGNGYLEVIEAWYQNGIPYTYGTIIWEIEAVRLTYPNGGEVFHPNDTVNVTWQTFDPPGCDSLSLFFSVDSGYNYDTIVTGIPASDTTYQWIVPDTVSNECFLMIWAYGPGVGWDFTDTTFTIKRIGVSEENPKNPKQEFRIYPNPAYRSVNIDLPADIEQLTLFDASGRQIEKFKSSPRLILNLPPGIYFLQIKTQIYTKTEKIIILR